MLRKKCSAQMLRGNCAALMLRGKWVDFHRWFSRPVAGFSIFVDGSPDPLPETQFSSMVFSSRAGNSIFIDGFPDPSRWKICETLWCRINGCRICVLCACPPLDLYVGRTTGGIQMASRSLELHPLFFQGDRGAQSW